MDVRITAKKVQINDTFKEHAEKKLKKLDRFFGESASAKVKLSPSKDKIAVEVTVIHDSLVFRAEHVSYEKTEALDGCVDGIIRQIRKNKTKVEKRLRDRAFADGFDTGDDADEAEEGVYHITKRKQFTLRPMSPDEAILQMNMLGHNFFMFKNAENGEITVAYKRGDGNYALLEPTFN